MKDLLLNYIKTSDPEFEKRIDEIEGKLKEALKKEERKLLIEYANAHFDYIHSHAVENFKHGFWTGFEIRGDLLEL
ncbi:MAG: hypothetical protein FWE74_10710 [Oscillospiraceae bacterium]|nr:hypothetical protein [Oscillospiraceae bacterium]